MEEKINNKQIVRSKIITFCGQWFQSQFGFLNLIDAALGMFNMYISKRLVQTWLVV